MLIKQLEDEHPADFARLALLGALYEETGDSREGASRRTRARSRINPRQIDLRLQDDPRCSRRNGELDKAIAEYEALIRAAPEQPAVRLRGVRGAPAARRPRARAEARDRARGARPARDEEVLSRLADFYARIGENDRSLKVLQRLAQASSERSGAPRRPRRPLLPGRQHAARGADVEAHPRRRCSRARSALAALGDVYLEHDMTTDALAAYKEAVAARAARTSRTRRRSPRALERTQSYREARAALTRSSPRRRRTKGDKVLAREAARAS